MRNHHAKLSQQLYLHHIEVSPLIHWPGVVWAQFFHKFKLDYKFTFLNCRKSHIKRGAESSVFIWNGIMYNLWRYIWSAKLLLKIDDVFPFVKQHNMRIGDRIDNQPLNLVHFDNVHLWTLAQKMQSSCKQLQTSIWRTILFLPASRHIPFITSGKRSSPLIPTSTTISSSQSAQSSWATSLQWFPKFPKVKHNNWHITEPQRLLRVLERHANLGFRCKRQNGAVEG